MRRIRQTGRSGARVVAVVGAVLAVAGSAGAGATVPAPPRQDSAVGHGDTNGSFTDIDFSLTSGPSGENFSGYSQVVYQGFRFGPGPLDPGSCFSVRGNTATTSGRLGPNPFGFVSAKVTVVDNGPADSGLDTYAAEASDVASDVPLDCTPTTTLQSRLTSGDIVVIDSPPPTPPRLQFQLRFKRGRDTAGHPCFRNSGIDASVSGPDSNEIGQVAFRFGRRPQLLDREPPFTRTIDRTTHRGHSHRHNVAARVSMLDGRHLKLKQALRACAGE